MAQRTHSATAKQLARDLLELADDASMPDSFWQSDSRIARACEILGVGKDERYTKSELWTRTAEERKRGS